MHLAYINEDLRRVKWLVECCPFSQALRECPFKPLRRMDPQARLQWIDRLSEQGAAQLLERHHSCFRRRQQADLASSRSPFTPALSGLAALSK